MSILEDVADDLAKRAIAAHEASGDETIVDKVSEALGASSQTLQEAYLTAVRVRRAEARALRMLGEFETMSAARPAKAGAKADAGGNTGGPAAKPGEG